MPKYSYTHKSFNKLVGKAIHCYNMISEGDKLAIGLSGGKDSLSLMWALKERKKRVLANFNFVAIYVDPGFSGCFTDELVDYCHREGYELVVENSDFGPVAHSLENKENPCFLCSRHRRQRLFEAAERLGCGKLALGHNKDDIIETLFLNIFYSGQISTMLPSQELFKGKMRIIRPLTFVDECTIRRFASERKFPDFVNECPSAGKTKRQDIKDMLNLLYKTNQKIRGNIFKSLSNVKTDYLLM